MSAGTGVQPVVIPGRAEGTSPESISTMLATVLKS
jgi:hypothetical protein